MNTKEMFRYEDGSIDTPDEELLAVRTKIYEISDPIMGQIYNVEGHRCICIALNASYGGGMSDCWAVEGHSAQMTFFAQTEVYDGYIKGKCLEICEDPLGIIFQPHSEIGWEGKANEGLEKRFININNIGRFDINWY